ncbi:MAG: hypothetical protein JRF47_17535 [Deltaproteobacteria bacterium]|nr:hypothetical protein [Deltaproteobacteria bacterium]
MDSQPQNESGIEIPNQRVLEFLRSVPPFDTLGASELTRVVSQIEMAYFPRGQRIKSKGSLLSTPVYHSAGCRQNLFDRR